jgi:hypothetical protein
MKNYKMKFYKTRKLVDFLNQSILVSLCVCTNMELSDFRENTFYLLIIQRF